MDAARGLAEDDDDFDEVGDHVFPFRARSGWAVLRKRNERQTCQGLFVGFDYFGNGFGCGDDDADDEQDLGNGHGALLWVVG